MLHFLWVYAPVPGLCRRMARSVYDLTYRKQEAEALEAYTGFAAVYDTFMDNVPYREWGGIYTLYAM